jgi:hypothetical protein
MLVYQRVAIEHGEPIIKHGDFNIHQQEPLTITAFWNISHIYIRTKNALNTYKL